MDLKGELPELKEQYGSSRSSKHVSSYNCDHMGIRKIDKRPRAIRFGVWETIVQFIKEAFLPQGYPDTVSEDYLQYQLWDTLQAFCSSITGMLTTLAILKGVGVGDSTATPLAATLTWMFKDGAGMISKILFAWMQGVDLDCNAKRWRLFADVLNDVGKFLELLAPIFPKFFLLLVCTASVSTAIVGTAGMATRAAMVQHQARRDNMADVAAKDNSQETVVNLVGLLVNLWLSPLVANNPILVWSLFVLFTILHILANHRAVSVVCMETFNKNRLHIVMSDYLTTGHVPSPTSVNSREPITTRSTRILSYTLGAHLSSVVMSSTDYRAAVKRCRYGSKHILKYNSAQRNVMVSLDVASSASDQLIAAISVEILDYIISGHHPLYTSDILAEFTDDIRRLNGVELADYVVDVVCPSVLPSLLPAMSHAGWHITHNLLATREWRYCWDNNS